MHKATWMIATFSMHAQCNRMRQLTYRCFSRCLARRMAGSIGRTFAVLYRCVSAEDVRGWREEKELVLTLGLLLQELFARTGAAWCFGVRHRLL